MDKKKDPKEEKESEITEKMKQWREAHPKATLTEIEEAVDVELAKLRGQLVEKMAQAGADKEEEVPECRHCGEKMVKNGRKKRKLQAKEGETIQLERQQWRCLGCGATLFPPG